MEIKVAKRVKKLPPYLFKEIDRLREEVRAKGVDVIDLGVGDPDQPTPPHIIAELQKTSADAANHRYPSYSGMHDFKYAAARWYQRRFGVELDPQTEVVSLIGSKEGIAHFPLAFIDPGDVALITSPGYPVYRVATMFAGGESYLLPLKRENGFLPNLAEIPANVLERARLLFFNYPNNPTAGVADVDFFTKTVEWAREHNIILCHDAAYTELAYDDYRAPSMLEVPGARDVAIEFHSLSKTYNMTGWRIGFAVGNAELVAGLGNIKSNIDSGVFQAVQWAGIAALESAPEVTAKIVETYRERRDTLIAGLRGIGIDAPAPQATFYVWLPVPDGYTSQEFTALLLERAGIVTTPGNGFGAAGEGYIRMALTVDTARLEEAVARMAKIGF